MNWKELARNLDKMNRTHQKARERSFETMYEMKKGGCAVIIGMMTAIIGVLGLIVKII